MKILTADEMRAVDRVTSERFGVDSLDLMRHAGAAVARFVLREFPERRQIAVLCGKGNNGGDGFVAARELANAGCDVRVLLLGRPADLKGDAKAAFGAMGLVPVLAPDDAALAAPEAQALLTSAALLIDAVVGTGFTPPLRGVAATLRDRVNRARHSRGRHRSALRLGCRFPRTHRWKARFAPAPSSPSPRPNWLTSAAT